MKLFLISICVGLCSIGYGQSIVITRGPQIKSLKEHSIDYKQYMIESGSTRTGYYSVDKKNKNLFLGMTVDKDKHYRVGVLKDYIELTETKVMAFEIPGEKAERYRMLKLAELGNKRFLFYKIITDDTEAVYANQVDNEFVVLGSPLKLQDKKKRFGTMGLLSSQDGQSILIFEAGVGEVGKKATSIPKNKTELLFSMRDAQLGVVWEAEYEMPIDYQTGVLGDIAMDNDRNLYILNYTGSDKYQRAELHQYYWKTKEWRTTPIGKVNARTQGCRLKILNGTTPVIAGVYDTGKIEGFFITVGDPAKKTFNEIISKPFPGFELGNGLVPSDFYGVSKIVTTENGNLTISVEGSSDYGGVAFRYSNVFLQQVDPTGKEVWHGVVDKKQTISLFSNAGGHALIPKGNDIIVLYNDHHTNAKQPPGSKKVTLYHGPETDHVLQRFDPSGKATKEIIHSAGNGLDLGMDVQTMIPLDDNLYHIQLWHMRAEKIAFAYAVLEVR